MDYYEPSNAFEFPEMKHSGLGIASFVIAVTVGLLEFVLVAIAGVLEVTTRVGLTKIHPGCCAGALFAGRPFRHHVGDWARYRRTVPALPKKTFAVLGVAIGAVVLFGVLLVMAVGSPWG